MKALITEVMREFYAEGVPKGIVPREVDYFEKLRAATIVKGMRRTGKTYVTYQRMQELLDQGVPLGRIVHINFEDERLAKMTMGDLHWINEIHAELYPECASELCWYFLDELQNVKGWESYARRIVDAPRIMLCLTGSSARLLGEEIATQMRGRDLPIEVFPLSFREYLNFNKILKRIPTAGCTTREKGALRRAMADYLECGGFPDVQGLPNRIRTETLQGYVDAVLYRDIIERYQVPSIQTLRYTLDYLLHNYARKISTRAISGVLKNLALPANRETIAEYLGYFQSAYLTYPVSIHSQSLAVKRVNPDKHYLVDTGIIRAMCVKTDAELGWMLENLVFMQLRRGFNKIEYYVTRAGDEVDFLVESRETHDRRLIQVAWEMSKEDTEDRELKALRAARDELGVKDCTVVTWDSDRETADGVKVVPVWRWCLK